MACPLLWAAICKDEIDMATRLQSAYKGTSVVY